MEAAERIARLDTGLFAHVESQTSDDDRRSLLAVHTAIAEELGTFSFLEIGSYRGGTLQPFVADGRCTRIVSIDPRPGVTPDDRFGTWDYENVSTELMLSLLADVPGADLSKVQTIEASVQHIPPGSIARPDLAFIDGEHTYAACLRDARFCRTVMQGAGVIMFHDHRAIERAIRDFCRETRGPLKAYPLYSGVFVVELGVRPSLLNKPEVRGQLVAPLRWTWSVANRVGLARELLAAAYWGRNLKK